jgi:CDP-glucose 4,6-dehydratase
VVVDGSFWRGRRVLVTGHTGFKGSWVSLWLTKLGADVFGLALPPPHSPSLFEAADIAAEVQSSFGDIRDRDWTIDMIAKCRPQVVLHLAAVSTVQEAHKDPEAAYATNVGGTLHVLEAARRAGTVDSMLVVTSDKCYRPGATPRREDDPLGGDEIYSSSKAGAELLVAAYRNAFLNSESPHSFAVATARAGNVIGGGDWTANRLLPDLMRAFVRGQTARVRNPEHVRPWQHVLDPIAGYLTLLQALNERGLAFGEAWNFGPSEQSEHTVSSVADSAAAAWGASAKWTQIPPDTIHETRYLTLDSSKATDRLGWTPKLMFDQAIAWTTEWYRRVQGGDAARRVTEEQIATYGSLT